MAVAPHLKRRRTGGFSLLELLLATATLGGLFAGFMVVYRSQESVHRVAMDAIRMPDRAGRILARLAAADALGGTCWPDGYQPQAASGPNSSNEKNAGGSDLTPNWIGTAVPLPAAADVTFPSDWNQVFGSTSVTLPCLRRQFGLLGTSGFRRRTIRFQYDPRSAVQPVSSRAGGLYVYDEDSASGPVALTGSDEIATMSFFFPDVVRVSALTTVPVGGAADALCAGADYQSKQGVGPSIRMGATGPATFTILGLSGVPKQTTNDFETVTMVVAPDRTGMGVSVASSSTFPVPGGVTFAPGRLFAHRLWAAGDAPVLWCNWGLDSPPLATASMTLRLYPAMNESRLPSFSVGIWMQLKGGARSTPLYIRDIFPVQVSHLRDN